MPKPSGDDRIRGFGNIGDIAASNVIFGKGISKIEDEWGDTAKVLYKVADFIKQSNETGAEILFKSFMEELQNPKPDKKRLRSLWDGMGSRLPAVNTITGVAAKILPLFML